MNLQTLLHQVYEQGSYDLVIDYVQKAIPPLAENDEVWLKNLLSNSEKLLM